MKHNTEYLFGRDKDYFEPELTALAELRVQTARDLLRALAQEKDEEHTPKEMEDIITRYTHVEKALAFWCAIWEEE